MTEQEERHVFHSWGGIMAELAQLGVICFQVREEKSYRLCPAFAPVSDIDAETALARRYFTHFGPATLRDAAYLMTVVMPEESTRFTSSSTTKLIPARPKIA